MICCAAVQQQSKASHLTAASSSSSSSSWRLCSRDRLILFAAAPDGSLLPLLAYVTGVPRRGRRGGGAANTGPCGRFQFNSRGQGVIQTPPSTLPSAQNHYRWSRTKSAVTTTRVEAKRKVPPRTQRIACRPDNSLGQYAIHSFRGLPVGPAHPYRHVACRSTHGYEGTCRAVPR